MLVSTDPGFVTQTSVVPTGWLSGSARPIRSRPRLKEMSSQPEGDHQISADDECLCLQ